MRFRAALLALSVLWAAPAAAQITGLTTFSPATRILSADVNGNFTALADEALNRTGGAITGNITVASGVTIDGVDVSAWLGQNVSTSASPTFAAVTATGAVGAATATLSSTAADALDVAGGITAGTGNVAIIGTDGRLPALSTTYLANLSGTNLTGVGLLGSNNAWAARQDLLTYSETKTAPAITSNVLTLDLATGTHFEVALDAAITTLTISNVPSASTVSSFTLKFTADGTPRAVTWPASIKWANAAAPSLTSTNGKVDIFTFLSHDGGTTWYAFVGGQAF